MLADWDHIRVLKPALTSTNRFLSQRWATRQRTNLGGCPCHAVEHGDEMAATASAGAVHELRAKPSYAIHW